MACRTTAGRYARSATRHGWRIALIAAIAFGPPAAAAVAAGHLDVSTGVATGGQAGGGGLRLAGSRAGRQLVVTAIEPGPAGGPAAERLRDVTHEARYRIDPPTLAAVSASGFLTPRADGTGTIVVEAAGLPEVRVPLVVERFGADPLIDFDTQVVPIFTKHGCNGGGCHGALAGKGGFRLSLFGYDPAADHLSITRDAHGRRIDLADGQQSPHAGGAVRAAARAGPGRRLRRRLDRDDARRDRRDATSPDIVE